MIIASLLSSSNYIILNKDLARVLGLHEAIILGELCSEYNYWESTNKLEKDGYFYSTRKNIEKQTLINEHYQKLAFKNLEQKGVIKSKKMGIPCKKYYKIIEEKVIEYLKMAKIPVGNEVMNKTDMSSSSTSQSDDLQEENNMPINNNNIINNKEHTQEYDPSEEKIEYATKVTMTEKEYQDLIKTYGEETTKQLIEQLNLYKEAKKVEYDNDYAAILRWVTTRLREMEKEDAKYKEFKSKDKNKSNFSQREYPPGFFDNLYSN